MCVKILYKCNFFHVFFLGLNLDLSLIHWLDNLYGIPYHINSKIFPKLTILI